MRTEFLITSLVVFAIFGALSRLYPILSWSFVFILPLFVLGIWDCLQRRHSIRRNFPVLGHMRYLLESIRPEISQYFIESNIDGVPFSREQRSVVYQRSKRQLDTLPFGTQHNVYDVGYEWANHSMNPSHVDPTTLRVSVGGPQCRQPYSMSVFNISAMSYGSLSRNAILALNGGAKIGGFAHDTGEGGLTQYHLQPGGDLVWEIGTGYFGCRTPDGKFSPEKFREKAQLPSVKMINIKLSQGAKPGHGGILPAEKLTEEIAQIRGVELGKDVVSPPGHTAFSSARGLIEFVGMLRELSGGKPVGFKFCLGRPEEFFDICRTILETKIYPDFVTVDGGEGGTGAAPIEFSNSVGFPLTEALVIVRNALVGFDLKKHIRILCSGKVVTGFDIVNRLCLGADICNSARGMMMALGCIQALRCNSNKCPTGVATQDPSLVVGLSVPDKKVRVANYHRETVRSAADIMGAMGIRSMSDLHPSLMMKRTSLTEVKTYAELYDFVSTGAFAQGTVPKTYHRWVEAPRMDRI